MSPANVAVEVAFYEARQILDTLVTIERREIALSDAELATWRPQGPGGRGAVGLT